MSTTTDDGTPYAHLLIEAKPQNGAFCARPSDIILRLSTGHALGGVQAITWHAKVGELVIGKSESGCNNKFIGFVHSQAGRIYKSGSKIAS